MQVQSPTRDATLLLLLQVPPYDAAYYPTLYHIYIGRERQWRGATGTALVVCQAPAENTHRVSRRHFTECLERRRISTAAGFLGFCSDGCSTIF